MDDADVDEGGRRSRPTARTRTRASAARRSSASWCTRRWPPTSPSAAGARRGPWSYGDPLDPTVDMGTVIDERAAMLLRSAASASAVAQGAQPAARQPAPRRAVFADACSTACDREMDGGAAGDLRPGVAGDHASRTSTTRSASSTAPPTACRRRVHQPPRRHHALRARAARSARSTSGRCRATGSSSRRSAASRTRAWATRKACRKPCKSFTNVRTYSLPW